MFERIKRRTSNLLHRLIIASPSLYNDKSSSKMGMVTDQHYKAIWKFWTRDDYEEPAH